MTLYRFIDMLFLDVGKAELQSIVSVIFDSLLLCDNARTCLNDRHGNNISLFVENLSHTDFLSDNTLFHF